MEGSQGGSGAQSPAPFLIKTYDMVDDPSTNATVSWSHGGNSFVVWNAPEFARDLLPKYFKHNNFSSFVRQLNTYGFRKKDPDQWEFANDGFLRGKKYLLKNIHRRKPIHSHSLQPTSGPLTEIERQELEEEVEKLKHDKGLLIHELRQHAQQQQGMELQMHNLEERLQNMAFRQKDIMDILSDTVQKPDFLSDLVHHHDVHSKKRRFLKDFLCEDPNLEEERLVTLQGMNAGTSDIMWPLDTEPFEKLESSLNSLENFFRDVSQASGGEMDYDGAVARVPALYITQVHATSGDTGTHLQPPSPKFNLSSACLEELNSSPDLDESTSYAESPTITSIEIQTDTRAKIPEIDVNSEPAALELISPRDQVTVAPANTAPAGVNDVFWQQFLTETPGSADPRDPQEVQSERREVDAKISEEKIENQGNVCWNSRNVDHLTEQMGNLTPAERA